MFSFNYCSMGLEAPEKLVVMNFFHLLEVFIVFICQRMKVVGVQNQGHWQCSKFIVWLIGFILYLGAK